MNTTGQQQLNLTIPLVTDDLQGAIYMCTGRKEGAIPEEQIKEVEVTSKPYKNNFEIP